MNKMRLKSVNLTLLCLGIIALMLLIGCSEKAVDSKRISILEEKSSVVYVESHNLIVPTVFLKNNRPGEQSIDHFFITFDVKAELEPLIKQGYKTSIDSRNLDLTDLLSERNNFYTGVNLVIEGKISRNDLEKMIQEGNIIVSIIEPNGDVVTSLSLEKFVIGKPDGSVVEP